MDIELMYIQSGKRHKMLALKGLIVQSISVKQNMKLRTVKILQWI